MDVTLYLYVDVAKYAFTAKNLCFLWYGGECPAMRFTCLRKARGQGECVLGL